MNERTNLAANIKYLRTRNRMTQRELAEKLGVRQTTVSEWEKGNREPDSIEMLKKVCNVFNVRFDEILDYDLSSHCIAITPKTQSNEIAAAIARKLEELSEEQRKITSEAILNIINAMTNDKGGN